MEELRFSWSSIFSSTPSSLTNTSIAARKGGKHQVGAWVQLSSDKAKVKLTSLNKLQENVKEAFFCFASPVFFFRSVTLLLSLSLSVLSQSALSPPLSVINQTKQCQMAAVTGSVFANCSLTQKKGGHEATKNNMDRASCMESKTTVL